MRQPIIAFGFCVVVLVILMLGGCATWEKPGSTRAEWNEDNGYCTAQATYGMGRFFPKAVYAGCMEHRGWERSE